MPVIKLDKRADGVVSVTLAAHGHHVIRIPDPAATPHTVGETGLRAWNVVKLMDGLTVRRAHEILRDLETGIQGKIGRPLGWIADAITAGNAELHEGEKQPHGGTKVCPAPGCGKEFKGKGWDGIDAHWRSEHRDFCSYETFWQLLQNIEAGAQPVRQRKIIAHLCKQCGKSFEGVRQAVYCSDKCRYDAANKRRKSS